MFNKKEIEKLKSYIKEYQKLSVILNEKIQDQNNDLKHHKQFNNHLKQKIQQMQKQPFKTFVRHLLYKYVK